jgi:hypothetical protein
VADLGEGALTSAGRALIERLSGEAKSFAVDALEAKDGSGARGLPERVRKAAAALWLRRARARLERLTTEVESAEKKGDEELLLERLKERQELSREMHRRRSAAGADAGRQTGPVRAGRDGDGQPGP